MERWDSHLHDEFAIYKIVSTNHALHIFMQDKLSNFLWEIGMSNLALTKVNRENPR